MMPQVTKQMLECPANLRTHQFSMGLQGNVQLNKIYFVSFFMGSTLLDFKKQ